VGAADVKAPDHDDGETVKQTIVAAQGQPSDATERECRITEVVADTGSNKTQMLARLGERGIRS
jgi:hypothetical protein